MILLNKIMRPILNSEVIIHERDKKVNVYKIDQFYCSKRNKDARDVYRDLLMPIFVNLIITLE
jgi:hypothetical protein